MTSYREWEDLDDDEQWESFQDAEETIEALRKRLAKLRELIAFLDKNDIPIPSHLRRDDDAAGMAERAAKQQTGGEK